ncbi:energy-coupling factor transporter ATPase [Gordonibacter massiliensis (ex Traore et al. 2017)]|uniref:energy-coupling factor transporter ATPase n=1 Tax=Gordonibacter massiliensis (ex Traore et al. 2017) TaxID=1841863 RepID=UPI001C8C2BA7|nr:energy-coupling factor transporter ATPase [Gordonibacter massiliensis (ex Traore et al. 2017)]MBX9035198.1 energy-coupling factor transporter ATPase [Gordonibacter massiliensis (ex Traore et al. 2017)]
MIDCTDIEFTYDGERLALAGVDLHVGAGEFVCILGGNGSGKSTLAKHLNALLLPDKGSVTVDGYSTAEARNVYRIRSTAGMVFQNPDDQLVASLVEDDVAFGPENLGVETAELVRRVEECLRQVGLVGFETHETQALSGGQKQRVAIAGVLAMQPKVLILDEASAMLDPRGRKGLMRVCKELNAQGMAVVMITHFMEEAAEADRVVVLDHGKVACKGAPQDVLVRTDVLANLNLEVPFACDLSLKLQELGLDVPTCVKEPQLVDAVASAIGEGSCPPVILSGATGGSAVEGSRAAQAGSATAVAAGDPSTAPLRGSAQDDKEGCVAASAQDGGAESVAASTCDDNSDDAVIAFQGVSFTYNPSKGKRKRGKRAKAEAEAGKRADWGNDPDAVWALRDIDFSVKRGEFFGIAGHTGSGKSTLIQHMNGILHPTRGRVLVEGRDVADKAQAASVRADVGVVFQYPEHQLFADTVYNDVAFGPRNLKLSDDEVDARVRESLELVRLDFDEVQGLSPFELSGGQQRRVAFAGVLAMRPGILVLDEPVAGLDPAARRDFLALIAHLHEQGRTVVMISHSMDDLAERCDRVLVLNEGETFEVGTPGDVFLRAGELNGIGLGIPAAQRVANGLRERGVPLPAGVLFDSGSLARALVELAGGKATCEAPEGAADGCGAGSGRAAANDSEGGAR